MVWGGGGLLGGGGVMPMSLKYLFADPDTTTHLQVTGLTGLTGLTGVKMGKYDTIDHWINRDLIALLRI